MERRTFMSAVIGGAFVALTAGKPGAQTMNYFNRYRGMRELTRDIYDYGIVLGFGISPAGHLPDVGARRVDAGIELYKNKKIRKLLLSEGKDDVRDISGARTMQQYALEKSVPSSDIEIEEKAMTTPANAYYSKTDFLLPSNKKNNVIITSSDHMPRAKFLFDKFLGNDFLTDCYSEESGLYDNPLQEQGFLGAYSFFASFPLPIANGDHETLRNRYSSFNSRFFRVF